MLDLEDDGLGRRTRPRNQSTGASPPPTKVDRHQEPAMSGLAACHHYCRLRAGMIKDDWGLRGIVGLGDISDLCMYVHVYIFTSDMYKGAEQGIPNRKSRKRK